MMLGQGMLRQYATILLRDEKKPVTLDALNKATLLRRCQRFRAHASFLPPSAYRLRKKFYLTSAFVEPAPQLDDEGNPVVPEAPPQDPLAAVGMMKQNMMTMVSTHRMHRIH
jgi:hypothetical protein